MDNKRLTLGCTWVQQIVRGAVLTCLLLQASFFAHESKAEVLYGLTTDGVLGQINTSTSSWTSVRTVPGQNALTNYYNLAVYENTFVASWASVPSTGPLLAGDFVAFGTTSNDYCLLGHLPDVIGNQGYPAGIQVQPGTSTLMGYGSGNSTDTEEALWQFNLKSRNASLVSNSTITLSSCSSLPYATSFHDANTIYGLRTCATGSVPDGTYQVHMHFVKWTYASGAWSEALDIATTLPVAGPGFGMAEDPSNPNTLYVTANGSSNTAFYKLVLSGSTLTITTLSSISAGSYPIISLAYGPATSSIVSPTTVSDISCTDRALVPLQTMFAN